MTIWERFRYETAAQGKITALDLELTKRCNLSCAHCYKLRGPQMMDGSLFHRVLDQARELGIFMIGFNGGEPLSHPQFLPFARRVLEEGIFLTLVTNGTLITEQMVHELSAWKGIRFQVSLYGHDPASFSALTGAPGSLWEKALHSLELIRGAGFHLEVILLAVDQEIAHIGGFMASLKNQGFDTWVNPILFPREDGDETPLKFALSNENYLKLSQLEDYNPIPRCEGNCQACGAGVSSLSVDVFGNIVPCLLIRESLGKIPNTSLADALGGETLKNFIKKNSIPPQCVECDYYPHCVRCPGASVFTTGLLTGISGETCRMARLRQIFHSSHHPDHH
ncbi:radical SAM protein [Myxococcota bacterium]|nr:radical SAM protein [Myxococcota bacterium]MBU1535696.1 radical SAM protein [Myxococcota bacterium]